MDAVLVELEDQTLIFVARQFDTIIGVMTCTDEHNLFVKNNQTNIWLEEY